MRFIQPNGSYSLDDLPGNTQVCVSHSAFILPNKRGTGLGNKYHVERLGKIRELRYDLAICTIVASNVRQRGILIRNGWKKVEDADFESSKTGSLVELWYRKMS